MEDYFVAAKKFFKRIIPRFDTAGFRKLRNDVRRELKKKESEHIILIRKLKIIVLGDWNTKKKREKLYEIKNTLLRNCLYAETIDNYYDMKKKGGLSQKQILRICCKNHQLIVFIDGKGTGTLVEQEYLSFNYPLHIKILFFIKKSKFKKLKDKPTEYIKDFPSIIVYKESDLIDKILTYSRLRIYRLAEIIERQISSGRGLKSLTYKSWNKRLMGVRG